MSKLCCSHLKRYENKGSFFSLFGIWTSALLLAFYRTFLSGYFGGACRFYPSCSQYAQQAFKMHSFQFATRLVFRRLCRCGPWGSCGYDPVPSSHKKESYR